jgi:hypothetical protein
MEKCQSKISRVTVPLKCPDHAPTGKNNVRASLRHGFAEDPRRVSAAWAVKRPA